MISTGAPRFPWSVRRNYHANALGLESGPLTRHAAPVKTQHPCTPRSTRFDGRMIALALATALLVLTVATSAEVPAPRKVATVEGITEYQFDNGLRALLFPDNSQSNGSTSVDRVNYFETLSASDENLEFAIALEADRMMNSFIRKSDLDSEMTVVRNEFERGENSPQRVLSQRIEAAAYEWHNYGKSTIGNRSDIERVPIVNLQAFYKKFYQPDNVVLIVAGKFDEAKALAMVAKHFGSIPLPTRKLDRTWTEEPPQDGERLVTLRRVGDVSAVGVAYHIPAGPHEENASLQMLANILSTRPSGRLYKALVETKKAASASANAGREHDPGLLSLDAEVPRDRS